MKKMEICVVTPQGKDSTALSETFERLGYPVSDAPRPFGRHADDQVVVVDARAGGTEEWAEIERDLNERRTPAVLISDDDDPAAAELAKRLDGSVVVVSGESEAGYEVAVTLASLLRGDAEGEVRE